MPESTRAVDDRTESARRIDASTGGLRNGSGADRRRVVVVGPCASGKTTLVNGLRRLGYEAAVCGQEHSDIPTLWRRREPDLLIVLHVDIETIRRRRGRSWPAAILERQIRRLADAVGSADLILDASALDSSQVLAAAVTLLNGAAPGGAAAAVRSGCAGS